MMSRRGLLQSLGAGAAAWTAVAAGPAQAAPLAAAQGQVADAPHSDTLQQRHDYLGAVSYTHLTLPTKRIV